MATSSVTFFRQMGGTIGTAAFLSVLFTRLPTEIGGRIADAAAADPEAAGQAQQLQQGGMDGVLADTTRIQRTSRSWWRPSARASRPPSTWSS